MQVSVFDSQSLLSIDADSIGVVCKSVLDLEKQSCDELNVYFVDEKTICEIHQEFFNDPSPTDCISIEIDGPDQSPRHLGEIFISTKAAIDFAKKNNEETYQELTLYLVHGILHLLGYDDLEETLEQKMRLAEKRQMDYLLSNNLLIKK